MSDDYDASTPAEGPEVGASPAESPDVALDDAVGAPFDPRPANLSLVAHLTQALEAAKAGRLKVCAIAVPDDAPTEVTSGVYGDSRQAIKDLAVELQSLQILVLGLLQ